MKSPTATAGWYCSQVEVHFRLIAVATSRVINIYSVLPSLNFSSFLVWNHHGLYLVIETYVIHCVIPMWFKIVIFCIVVICSSMKSIYIVTCTNYCNTLKGWAIKGDIINNFIDWNSFNGAHELMNVCASDFRVLRSFHCIVLYYLSHYVCTLHILFILCKYCTFIVNSLHNILTQ